MFYNRVFKLEERRGVDGVIVFMFFLSLLLWLWLLSLLFRSCGSCCCISVSFRVPVLVVLVGSDIGFRHIRSTVLCLQRQFCLTCTERCEHAQIYCYLQCFHSFHVKKCLSVPHFRPFCKVCFLNLYIRVQNALQKSNGGVCLNLYNAGVFFSPPHSHWIKGEIGFFLTHVQT